MRVSVESGKTCIFDSGMFTAPELSFKVGQMFWDTRCDILETNVWPSPVQDYLFTRRKFTNIKVVNFGHTPTHHFSQIRNFSWKSAAVRIPWDFCKVTQIRWLWLTYHEVWNLVKMKNFWRFMPVIKFLKHSFSLVWKTFKIPVTWELFLNFCFLVRQFFVRATGIFRSCSSEGQVSFAYEAMYSSPVHFWSLIAF